MLDMPHISETGNATGQEPNEIDAVGSTPSVTERWRPVRGFVEYEVSDLGRVRRLVIGKEPRIIKGGPDQRGYRRVSLVAGETIKSFAIHRLVAAAFIGEPLPGMEVNHRNGTPGDNSLGNLEYVTRVGNRAHSTLLGLHRRRCETCGCSLQLHGPGGVGCDNFNPPPKGLHVRSHLHAGGIEYRNSSRTVLRVGRPRIKSSSRSTAQAFFDRKRLLSALSEVMGVYAEPIRRGVER